MTKDSYFKFYKVKIKSLMQTIIKTHSKTKNFI